MKSCCTNVQANLFSEFVQYQAGTTGNECDGCVHSTKPFNRILSYFLDLDAHRPGHDLVLACNGHVGAPLTDACA